MTLSSKRRGKPRSRRGADNAAQPVVHEGEAEVIKRAAELLSKRVTRTCLTLPTPFELELDPSELELITAPGPKPSRGWRLKLNRATRDRLRVGRTPKAPPIYYSPFLLFLKQPYEELQKALKAIERYMDGHHETVLLAAGLTDSYHRGHEQQAQHEDDTRRATSPSTAFLPSTSLVF